MGAVKKFQVDDLTVHIYDRPTTLTEAAAKIAQNYLITLLTKQSQATVTYKVNISGSQQIGLYSNVVTFLAVPNY